VRVGHGRQVPNKFELRIGSSCSEASDGVGHVRTRDRPRREALQVYGIFVWYATRFHACPVLPERALVVWASAVGCGPVCACVVCVCLIVRARECIYVGPHERVLLPTLAPHFAWARASQARGVRGNGPGYHVRSRCGAVWCQQHHPGLAEAAAWLPACTRRARGRARSHVECGRM